MTWIYDAHHYPINLPDTPQISREDADLIYRLDLTLAQWERLTDQERADLRWSGTA